MKRNHIYLLIATTLVIATATARVINAQYQLPNFVPIAAIGLFCGAIMKENRPLAFLIPLLGQFIADVYFQLFTAIPGFYDLTSQLFNYGALFAATALGTTMNQPKPLRMFGYVLGGSALFFLVSNFGFFASGWNGYSFAGLQKTYIDAIPFYKNSFISDLIGGICLFGGHAFIGQQLLKKAVRVHA